MASLAQKLENMDQFLLLEECLELAENTKHIAIALIKWTGLPEKPQTYSWLRLMTKRYGEDIVRDVTVSVLEAGTTLEDFDNDPRHFRSWVVATLKGKKHTKDQAGNVINLEYYK